MKFLKHKHNLFFALALAALGILPGCKKPPPPPKPVVRPTPVPTPSLDRIGFTRNGRLYTIKPDGSDLQEIFFRKDASVWFPCAGKSGAHFIAWVSKSDGTQNVARIEADGSRVEFLTAIDDRPLPEMKNLRLGNAPAYNSKGDKIAYSFNGDIWIMDADGYNAVTLIADHASWSPAWSPDDKKIAYVNGSDGHFNLWVTDVEDRDTYQVTDFEEYWVGHPRWASNGKNIFFTQVQKDTSIIAEVPANVGQALADSTPITRDDRSGDAEFSPDGLKMVYSDAKDDLFNWKVWVANADGSHPTLLTQDLGLSPAWLRPTVQMAAATVVTPAAGPSPVAKATPAQPSAVPTAVVAAKTPAPAAKPSAVPTVPANIAASTIANVQTKAAATPKPSLSSAAATAAKESSTGQLPLSHSQAVPTQPPVQAAPLRMSVAVNFEDGSDQLDVSALPALKKLASRVAEYKEGRIRIRGPLDNAPLNGKFASNLERSKARAVAVRHFLAQEIGASEENIEAVPYTPSMLGAGGAANGVQVLIELK